MYQFIPLITWLPVWDLALKKYGAWQRQRTKRNVNTEQRDQIGVAVQSFLWERLELMVWVLSRLERLNGIQWWCHQIPIRLTFYSYFYRPSMIIPYASIHSATSLITSARLDLKQMWGLTKGKTKKKPEHWTKRWNWSSCTTFVLTASWTHDLIARMVRVYEQKSVAVGLNPTQVAPFYSYL